MVSVLEISPGERGLTQTGKKVYAVSYTYDQRNRSQGPQNTETEHASVLGTVFNYPCLRSLWCWFGV